MPLVEVLFWVSFAVLFYVYAGYPFLLVAIAMFVPRRRPKADFTPRLSILIAAYNEQTGIRRKIEQTLALDYPSDLIEILVGRVIQGQSLLNLPSDASLLVI